jgi:hypothetical protein
MPEPSRQETARARTEQQPAACRPLLLSASAFLLLAGGLAVFAAAPPARVRPGRTAAFTPRQHAEAEMLAQLETVAPVDLDTVPRTSHMLWLQAEDEHRRKKERNPVFTGPLLHVARGRSDLRGLPFLPAEGALLKGIRALALDFLSRQVHSFHTERAAEALFKERKRPWKGPSAEARFKQSLAKRKWLRTEEAVPALVQLLQVEGPALRRYLLELLANNRSKLATAALVQRAVLDLSPAIREAAVAALKKRPPADVRLALLAALRQPWGPAADHAALALVALADVQAILPVQRMLDQADPSGPAPDRRNNLVLTELVRVNHLRNCLLCHAPSLDRSDPLRAKIPVPEMPLPDSYGGDETGHFVRADVTLLRPDFSAMHRVDRPGKWPAVQRFDYLLRTRALTAREEAAWERKARTPSPYHERLRFVLGKLHALKDGKAARE